MKATIKLKIDEVFDIIRIKFPRAKNIKFNLSERGDDRFGQTWKEVDGIEFEIDDIEIVKK